MITRNILLIFRHDIMYNPIIYKLATDFSIVFNVLEAKILPKQEGRLVLALEGEEEQLEKGIKYLQSQHVQVEVLVDKIKRDEEKCTHCGACVAVCKTDALVLKRPSMEVEFYPEKCVACGQCKIACPVKAMSGITIDKEVEI